MQTLQRPEQPCKHVFVKTKDGELACKFCGEVKQSFNVVNRLPMGVSWQPTSQIVFGRDVDLQTLMQNLAGTINTLAPTLINAFSAEVARRRGVKTELPLDFKASAMAKKQKYDFQVNIIIHFNGHNVLQNVNWESLAAKAEALDRQVEKGLR